MRELGKLEIEKCKEFILAQKSRRRRMTYVALPKDADIISKIKTEELYCNMTVILLNRYFKDDPDYLQNHLQSMNVSPEL